MAELSEKPGNAKCFCCGTPADQIAEPQRFRRKWRILWLFMLLLGFAMVAGGLAFVSFLSAPVAAYVAGLGFGWVLAGLIFIDKFPKFRQTVTSS